MSSQQTQVAEERFTARANGRGPDVDATLRMAQALEYIAAQLGQINAKLGALVSGLAGAQQKD
jgi:hypothetical protein